MSPGENPSQAAQAKVRPRTNPMEQFATFTAMLVGMLILIDPLARQVTGQVVGAVLGPLIGFGGAFPVLTVLLAGTVMVVATTVVRHYFTDYLEQARVQDIMRAFNREMREARKSNNLHRMKKLTEKNKEIMEMQAEQSSAQLKPMAITMVVAIPIFAWLLVFLDPGSEVPHVAVAELTDPSAWEVSQADLARDFPAVSQAVAAPGREVGATGAEHDAFRRALAGAGARHLRLADAPADRPKEYEAGFTQSEGAWVVRARAVDDPRAWTVPEAALASGGFPALAQALARPHTELPSARDEVGAIQAQLRANGTTHLRVLPSDPGRRPAEYLVGLPNPACEAVGIVPWDPRWCLDTNIQAKIPLLDLFPRWVALYSLFSIPVGQVLSRWLKARDLEAELAKASPAGA